MDFRQLDECFFCFMYFKTKNEVHGDCVENKQCQKFDGDEEWELCEHPCGGAYLVCMECLCSTGKLNSHKRASLEKAGVLTRCKICEEKKDCVDIVTCVAHKDITSYFPDEEDS